MDLKQRRILLYILMAATVISAVSAHFSAGQTQTLLIALTLVLIAALILAWMLLWRCPRCRKFLQGLNTKRCPHCGRDLKP